MELTLLPTATVVSFFSLPDPPPQPIDTMSEPASAVPKRMMTCPKNATQHPGRILTEAEGYTKRRTKAQKAADDKREKEEKQASEMATQDGYKCVAAFQKKMQTDQAAICADAPKPTRPRPRPVKRL